MCANSTSNANFRIFFVHGISYRPTDLSLLKEFSKKNSVLKIFIILFEQDCPEAVVHGQTNTAAVISLTFSGLNLGL